MEVNDDRQPPAADPRMVAGRYRLGPRRGSSPDAALFEAFDEQRQQPVVVKLVHPELSGSQAVRAAFTSSMNAAASLQHPNVAAVLDWGTTTFNSRDVLYVVSEQLAGGSLRDMLDRGRLLSPSQALVVGLDACKALDALHRAGLVHGDIRPSTLVFGADRRVRVVDAGVAQVLAVATGGAMSRINETAKYASPEEAVGGAAAAKSDVYSLCLSLLEAMTGSVPFVGDSTVATLANRVDKLMPVSADLGPLASVLERAGRPDPADRSTAAEFGRALVAAAERLPRPAPLPILAGSLFGGDATEPMPRPTPEDELLAGVAVPPAPVAVEPAPAPAPVVDAPGDAPVVDAPVDAAPVVEQPVDVVPAPLPAPVPIVPPPPLAPPAPVVVAGPPDSPPHDSPPHDSPPHDSPPHDGLVDPADEFPERPAPSGNRRWFIVALLVMAALGGTLAWYNSRPEQRTVPALAGLDQGVALNSIAGDFIGVIAQEASEKVAMGTVIRTQPDVGVRVTKGSNLTLFVSTGPAPRVLPDVTGLTLADATAKLQGLGLTVETGEPVFDEQVAAGVVVSWTVPDSPTLVAGGTVTKGTAVRLVASAGPAPRKVPDLKSATLADATTALAGVQLTIAQGPDQFSPTVPAGQVISQQPAAGTTLPRGSVVTVVLSKGADLVTVPDFTGLDYNGIVAAVAKSGLTWGSASGNGNLALQSFTINGAPGVAGQKVPRGARIDLVFASA